MPRITLMIALCLLGACGGRTERGDDDVGSGGAGDGGKREGGRGGLGWGTTPLDPCTPGPRFEAGKPCPWLADDHCYATRNAACACDCPTDRESICIESSSLVGEGEVDCY
jgi:hypothetical protein